MVANKSLVNIVFNDINKLKIVNNFKSDIYKLLDRQQFKYRDGFIIYAHNKNGAWFKIIFEPSSTSDYDISNWDDYIAPLGQIIELKFKLRTSVLKRIDFYYYLCERVNSLVSLQYLLMLCGDVESNPGPAQSKCVAQIGIEINHNHHLDIEGIFRSLDDDLFKHIETFCQKAGINFNDKIEKIKNRTVVTISSIISIYRWSHDLLPTPDLINALTTALLVVVPMSLIGKAMKMIFVGNSAQAGGFHPQTILRALCIVFFLVTCSKLPGKGTIDEFIVRVRNIPQALKSLESLWESIGPITKHLQQLFEKYGLGYDTSAEDGDFIGKVQAWADDVALYSDMYKKRLINRSSEAMDEAARLHPRGIKLAQECVHNQYDRRNLELIRSLLATSFKISEFALKSGADQCSVRPEPIIVWFQGESGVGKSTLLYPFIQDMMKAAKIGCDKDGILEPDWQKRIYARVPETKFWSGYNPHYHDVIIIDEAFQLRDSALSPSPELFEIIRLGNMFPYMLYMDSIEQKANTFSRAKLVVLTSNVKSISIESLTCPEAVKRRISKAFATNLKEEYKLYYEHQGHRHFRLDKSKVGRAMNTEVYEFQQFDTMTLEDVGPPMEYPIMLFECASTLLKNLGNFNRYDEALEQNRTASLPELTKRLLDAGIRAQMGEEEDQFYDAREQIDDTDDILDFPDRERLRMWDSIQEYKRITGVYAATQTVSSDRLRQRWRQQNAQIIDNPVAKYLGLSNEAEDIITNDSLNRMHVVDTIIVPPWKRKPKNYFEGVYRAARGAKYTMSMLTALGIRALVNRGVMSHSWDSYIDERLDPNMNRHNISGLDFIDAFDMRYREKPYEGVIFGQVGEDGEFIFPETNIRAAKSKYDSWANYFKKTYRELRFNLPALTASAIGLAITLYFQRHNISRLCQVVRPAREVTLKSKFKEMEHLINEAEKCAKVGCSKCKVCDNVTEKDLVLLDYWGVSCKCYAQVCDRAREKYKRLFVAYLDQRRNQPITTDKAHLQMCDFVRTCICEKCPLCDGNTECECLRLAIARGCSIDDINLVDKTGLYADICAQSRDPKFNQRSVKVQSKDPKFTRSTVKVQSLDPKTTQRGRVVVQAQDIEKLSFENIQAQGNVIAQSKNVSSDVASESLMSNTVYGSLLWMYIAGENDDVVRHRLGHVLMIKGQIALMNWHFIMALRDVGDARVVMRSLHGTVCAVLTPLDIVENAVQIGDKDACLVRLNKKGIQFRDLAKHFISKQQRMSLITENLMLARYNITSDEMSPFPVMITDATMRTEELEVEFDFQGREHSFVCARSWEYNAPTVFGDCGAPLVLYNSRIPTKLVGIHNARCNASWNAFGVPLYREDIEATLAQFPPRAQFGWTEDLEMQTTGVQRVLEGQTFIVMQAQKGQLPQANQSQVKPSPIFGEYIRTVTKPGPLRPFEKDGKVFNPASIARAKWGGLAPDVDPEYAAQADEVVKAMCLKSHPKECVEYTMPLTYEQAVVGIPGVDYIESINKMSSPGYPYVLNKEPGKGKTGYFGKHDFELETPQAKIVEDDVNRIEMMYLKNERPFIVWIDTLKDQRIPIEKAEAGKTRVFSAGPMHYTILFRKHVLPFIAHLNSNRIDNMFGPGINAVSTEWHKLALLLKSKGPHCIAGDYKQWDGWAPTRGFESFYEAALAWYELHWDNVVANGRNIVQGRSLSFEEYAAFFRNLIQDVISHVHLCNKEIDDEMYMLFYLVTNGVPSGCPSTANTNSACNLWAIAYCYFEIFAGTEFATVECFFRFIYAIFYGDDIAMNISKMIIKWFNQQTLTDAMKRNFNLTFTDEAKTGDVVPFRTLNEITFLKRAFKFNEDIQMYVAPLPEDLLLDILNWVRVGGENPYVITITNLQAVLGEMALNGRKYYDKYKLPFTKTLHRLSRGMGLVPCLDSYYGYVNKIRAGKLAAVEF